MARDQVVALARGVEVGPVVRQHQVGAEAAVALLPEPVDLLVDHVGRADGAEAGLVDEGDHLLHVAARHRHLREGGHGLEVVEPVRHAVFHVAVGLVHGLGAVHHAHQAPLVAVDLGLVVGGLRFHHVPVQGQGVEAGGGGGADGQQAATVAAGQLGAGGRGHRRDGHVEQRVAVGPQVQACVAQVPAVVLEGDRLFGGEQPHDDVQALFQQWPGLGLRQADHDAVRRQRARAQAEHHTAAGQVVELHDALGHPQRVVVADAGDARAQLDVLGAL